MDREAKRRTYIVSEAQHDFRSAIPSGSDVFGHETLVSSDLGRSCSRGITPSKSKVADFELAISIYKEIPRF